MMNIIIKIAALAMLLVSLIYFYGGVKEKHLGLIFGGIAWLVGSLLVYQYETLWFTLIAFVIALFLNKNPDHK